MTNFDSAALPGLNGASFPGASGLRAASLLGRGLPAVGRGTSPSTTVVRAVPRVRDKVAFVVPPMLQDSVATQLGQTNIHNYTTGATAVGEGASGPPPYREPV